MTTHNDVSVLGGGASAEPRSAALRPAAGAWSQQATLAIRAQIVAYPIHRV